MTFIPSVLSDTDNKNSTTITNTSGTLLFSGEINNTIGYNYITLTINSSINSVPGGIQIYFSDSTDLNTFEVFYTDTYIENTIFIKTYIILKKYYYINYTSINSTFNNNLNITSRLTTNNTSTNNNNSLTVFDNSYESSIDAFGKLRVSFPYTLLDIRFPGISSGNLNFQSNNLLINISNSNFTSTYGNSKLVMTGPPSGNGHFISQSKKYCVYQPGKSLLFLASGIIYPSSLSFTYPNCPTGYQARIGYFDSLTTNILNVNNGIYFQYDLNGISLCIKNQSLIQIYQNDWNIDPMNGQGPSRLNLNFSNNQIFVIDMEWLGSGRIRFGFYAYGKVQYCHQQTNINFLNGPYTDNINLPIRYELSVTNSTSSANITQICSTVISEGGYNPVGKSFTVSSSENNINVPTTISNIETPILAIRGGGSNFYHQNIVPNNIQLVDTSQNNIIIYRLRLYNNSTSLVSGFNINWTDVNSNYSVTQYAKSNNINNFNTTNSVLVSQDYFSGKGVINFTDLNNIFNYQALQITSDFNNDSSIIVITCTKIDNNTTDLYCSLKWKEIY